MNKRTIISILALSFLFFIPSVFATEITSCSVISEAGDYYLMNDILNSGFQTCINITGNDVTLDCQNYIIDGLDKPTSNITYGIFSTANNTLIKDCYVSDWGVGVTLYGTGGDSIIDNITSTSNTGWGVMVVKNNITIKDSDFTSNTLYSIQIGSSTTSVGLTNSNIFNNYITDSVRVFKNQTGTNFYNNVIITSAITGIQLISSTGNIFGGKIYDNNISDCSNMGIYFNSANTTATLYNITDFEIYGNRITNCSYGFSTIGGSSGGKIYNNKIYDNFINVTTDEIGGLTTYWENNEWNTTKTLSTNIVGGSYTGGNYWGTTTGNGYSDTCSVTIENGFCDNEFSIADGNIDYLPYNVNTILLCEPNFQLNSTENDCYNSTHYAINTTYYDFNECDELYIINYTYSELSYSYTTFYNSCLNENNFNRTSVYNDTMDCGYSIENSTYPTLNYAFSNSFDECLNENNFNRTSVYNDTMTCSYNIFNSTFPVLPYSYFNTTITCFNGTTANYTYIYNDTLSCSYNIYNSTLVNCSGGCSDNQCQAPQFPEPANLYNSFASGGWSRFLDSIIIPLILLIFVFAYFKLNPKKLKGK